MRSNNSCSQENDGIVLLEDEQEILAQSSMNRINAEEMPGILEEFNAEENRTIHDEQCNFSITHRWREYTKKLGELVIFVESSTRLASRDKKLELPIRFHDLLGIDDHGNCRPCIHSPRHTFFCKCKQDFLDALELYNGFFKDEVILAAQTAACSLETRQAAQAKLSATFSDKLLHGKENLQEENARLRAQLLAKDAELLAKDVQTAAKDLYHAAKDVYNAHHLVKESLGAAQLAGNETILSGGPETIESKRRAIDEASKTVSQNKARLSLGDNYSSPTDFQKFLDEETELIIPLLNTSQQDSMSAFHKQLQFFFKEAKTIPPNVGYREPGYDKLIKNSVEKILQLGGGTTIDLSVNKAGVRTHTQEQNFSECGIPRPVAEEEKGAHPILYAIMFRMAEILENSTCSQHGSQHVDLHHEQVILKGGCRRSRRCDYILNRDVMERLGGVVPGSISKVIEIKPIIRKQEKFLKLQEAGANQVLGHLAKSLFHAFNLGGVGVDCKVHGVVLTMISIEVIEMELCEVGTPQVRIRMRRTGIQPLFSRDTTMKILNGEKIDYDLHANKEGGKTTNGFMLLTHVLCGNFGWCEFKQQGSYFAIDGQEEGQVGRFLGNGAFSAVYTIKQNRKEVENFFLKVPMAHRMIGNLDCEKIVLGALDHESIPNVRAKGILTIKSKCEISKMDCLCLKGIVGYEALEWLRKYEGKDRSHHINTIIEKSLEAIKHAHQRKWIHCDIRPSNIVINWQKTTRDMKVLVIDWGCSQQENNRVKGFLGCPPFAHAALFHTQWRQDWKANSAFDIVSLAYTAACLIKNQAIPWHGFDGTTPDISVQEERRKTAIELLTGHQINCRHDCIDLLIGALEEEETFVQNMEEGEEKQEKKRSRHSK